MQEITPNVNEEKAAAEVHSYIKDMVAKYHHRPIPTTPAAGNVKTYYRDKLPAWAKKKISRKYPLYTKNGEKVCERYERIVIGDYGAYVEISASHLSDNHFIYIDQNDPIDETISSRHSSHMTLALNDESSYVSSSYHFTKAELNRLHADCVHAHAGTALRNDEIIFFDENAMVLNYIVEFQ